MNRRVMLPTAITLGLVLSIGFAGSASAFQIITDEGVHGDVTLVDSEASPAGVCGYQLADSSGGSDTYVFHSMKIRAPKIFAADQNPDKRDSRIVSWRFILLEYPPGSPGWFHVAKSKVQKARAYEDQAPAFTAQTVQYNGSQENTYRIRGVIKWFKPDGSIEGRVDLFVDWFKVKNTGFVIEDDCYGAYAIS